MILERHLSGPGNSAVIKLRLCLLLDELSQEQKLLFHIEDITNCKFMLREFALADWIDQVAADAEAVKKIRAAYWVWNGMHDCDRLVVLCWFDLLYSKHLPGISQQQKSQLFCRLFFIDFTPVLCEFGE